MDSNSKNNNNIGEYSILILMSLFWIPFLYSAQSYKYVSWHGYLFYSRLALFLIPIGAILWKATSKRISNSFIPIYYSLCMLIQASHGVLEPSNKIDFYSYTSLFLFMGALGYHGSLTNWIRRYLPLALLAHTVPVFFKTDLGITNFGSFVDVFTFNVAFVMFSIILIQIMSEKFKVYQDNIALKDTLLKEQAISLNLTKDQERKTKELARQVAHDIRSPLAALKSSFDDIKTLPQDTRLRIFSAINRVEDIANNLIRSNAAPQLRSCQSTELMTLIDSIISEKRQEFKSKPNIRIYSSFNSSSYGTFSSFNSGTLKRILSNIVTNSVEAMPSNIGDVKIKLYREDAYNVIQVSDNGTGIPADIIAKVTESNFTTKESGSGLGLYHANKELNAGSGKLQISSSDSGTTIKVFLKPSNPPSWFLSQIDIRKFNKIVILDDDSNIHHIWDAKLNKFNLPIIHSYSPSELKNIELNNQTLMLVDFDLSSPETNGIDVIKQYKEIANCILVTANNEDGTVVQECINNKIKLLPKLSIDIIPIENKDVTKDIVLIDDDDLVHSTWKFYFKKKPEILYSYKTINEFLSVETKFDKNTIIVVDSNLENGIKGEIESEKIFNCGFKNLYVSTGMHELEVTDYHWIKGVFDKTPHFLGNI